MTSNQQAEARKTWEGLTPQGREALRYFQTHDAYVIPDEDTPLDDFDRLFLSGLLQKRYMDMGGISSKARYGLTDFGNAVLAASSAAPATPAAEGKGAEGTRGNDPKAREKVISIVGDRLTSMLEDWLGEEMGEDLLTEYADGFLVTQLVSDIDEGIKQWAEKIREPKTLLDLVYNCCEEYLDDEESEE